MFTLPYYVNHITYSYSYVIIKVLRLSLKNCIVPTLALDSARQLGRQRESVRKIILPTGFIPSHAVIVRLTNMIKHPVHNWIYKPMRKWKKCVNKDPKK